MDTLHCKLCGKLVVDGLDVLLQFAVDDDVMR